MTEVKPAMESRRAGMGPLPGKAWEGSLEPQEPSVRALGRGPRDLGQDCRGIVVTPWTLRGQPGPPVSIFRAAAALKVSLWAVEIFQDFRRGFLRCGASGVFPWAFCLQVPAPGRDSFRKGWGCRPGCLAALPGTFYPWSPTLPLLTPRG